MFLKVECALCKRFLKIKFRGYTILKLKNVKTWVLYALAFCSSPLTISHSYCPNCARKLLEQPRTIPQQNHETLKNASPAFQRSYCMYRIIKSLQLLQELDPFISVAIILSAALLLALIFAGSQFKITVNFKWIKLIFVYLGLKRKKDDKVE